MRIEVDIDPDEMLHGVAAIVRDPATLAWVLYLPGQTPCICDTFKDASSGMNQWIAKEKKRAKRRAYEARREAKRQGKEAAELIPKLAYKGKT